MRSGFFIQAVFFDFDGVICDSVDVKTEAFDRLYADYDDDVRRMVREYHLRYGGISRYEKIRHFEQIIHGRPAEESTVERKADEFAALVVDAVVASPYVRGAEQALEKIKDICPLFVVSGTPQEELREIVERRELAHYFEGVFGSPSTKSDIIAKLLADSGLEAGQAVMIGDAMTDYDAACDNGVPFVGVVGAGKPSPFPAGTRVIDDLTELPEILTVERLDNKI